MRYTKGYLKVSHIYRADTVMCNSEFQEENMENNMRSLYFYIAGKLTGGGKEGNTAKLIMFWDTLLN